MASVGANSKEDVEVYVDDAIAFTGLRKSRISGGSEPSRLNVWPRKSNSLRKRKHIGEQTETETCPTTLYACADQNNEVYLLLPVTLNLIIINP
jgi:hypothetical protein